MYYLDNPQNCKFCRHEINIELSMFQKALRSGDGVNVKDMIIAQAFWEICNDFQEYGPFKIAGEWISNRIYYRLYYDQALVLEIKKSDNVVFICYIRSNNYAWAEELCMLANAHAKLILYST